jgi:hypothetical protein
MLAVKTKNLPRLDTLLLKKGCGGVESGPPNRLQLVIKAYVGRWSSYLSCKYSRVLSKHFPWQNSPPYFIKIEVFSNYFNYYHNPS